MKYFPGAILGILALVAFQLIYVPVDEWWGKRAERRKAEKFYRELQKPTKWTRPDDA